MRALAKALAAGLAFIAIGTVVSLAVVLPHRAHANPDPGMSYVWQGLWHAPGSGLLYCYPWSQFTGYHACWHDDESAGLYYAADFSYYWPEDCMGEPVWLEYTGDFQLFKMAEYTHYCTGIRAKIYYGSYDEGNFMGDINYLHVDKNDAVIDQEVPGQWLYIGDILDTDNPNCSTDSHLHQSADVSSGTPFYTNKLADPSQDENWEHAIFWGDGNADYDGDDFTNENELYIRTDAYDNCPDGSWDDAWPLDINKDRYVTIADVYNFSGRIGATGGPPPSANWMQRLDLNTDNFITMADVFMYRGKINTTCL
jgi:hypothetical protein